LLSKIEKPPKEPSHKGNFKWRKESNLEVYQRKKHLLNSHKQTKIEPADGEIKYVEKRKKTIGQKKINLYENLSDSSTSSTNRTLNKPS